MSFLVASTSLTKDLGLSQQDVAVLLGTALGFTAVGGLLGGAFADRFGRKPLLMITILLYCLGTLLSGFAIGFWTLLVARAITGIGVGGEWAVAHAADDAARLPGFAHLAAQHVGGAQVV